MLDNVEEKTKDTLSNVKNIKADPADIREDIKSKFLVEMPEDFYKFWDFAKSLHPKNPQGIYFEGKSIPDAHLEKLKQQKLNGWGLDNSSFPIDTDSDNVCDCRKKLIHQQL